MKDEKIALQEIDDSELTQVSGGQGGQNGEKAFKAVSKGKCIFCEKPDQKLNSDRFCYSCWKAKQGRSM